MESITIGKLARCTGVGIETIRFYEREGLLEKPARKSTSHYRQYGPETIQRLRFVLKAKDLGFSLREIKDLLRLRADSVTQCDAVRKRAQEKMIQVQKKIFDLRRIEQSLMRLVSVCHQRHTTSKCPILDFLSEDENMSSHPEKCCVK